MPNAKKKILRSSLLEQRGRCSLDTAVEASANIMENIRSLPDWKNAKAALLYWPIRGEVDVRPLAAELWQRGDRVLLPRCRTDAAGEMDLACAAGISDLVSGPYSIMEPDSRTCPTDQDTRPTIALVPGVGFDPDGNRLGFGGGYYDRVLAQERMSDALIVGVAYDFQVVERVPVEEWDRPMHAICTEKGLWRT